MACVHYPEQPASDIRYNAADAGVVIDVGDLIYHDGTYFQPASAQADQLSEDANQRAFAPNFVGVAKTRRTGSESADGDLGVQTECILHYPCASATFEYGDLLTVDEAGSGTALEDQKLVKTTDERLAIATCVKREASAVTKVWAHFKARKPASGGGDSTPTSGAQVTRTITFDGETGDNKLILTDNLANALDITQGANSYLKFVTTDSAEAVVIGKNVTLTDGKTITNSANVTGTSLWGASDKGAFFGGTPVVQRSAYTQTYATADRTHAAPTATVLTAADGAGTNDNTIGAITADASVIAAVQEIVDEVNKLIADVADVKQIANALIDDMQALALCA